MYPVRISFLIILVSIVVCNNSCISHKESKNKIPDFTLSVEFIPALFRTALCVIKKDGLECTMSLDFIYTHKDRIPEDTIMMKKDNNTFFKNFPSDLPGDTLLIDSVETVIIENDQIENFIRYLHNDIITQTDINKDNIKIDGYAICFNYKTDSINHNFIYRSLSRDDTAQYRILREIVTFMDENLKSKISKMYTKSWKEILKN